MTEAARAEASGTLLRRLVGADGAPGEEREQRLRRDAFLVASISLLAVSAAFTVIGLLLGRPPITVGVAVAFGVAVLAIVLAYRRDRRLERALRLLLTAGLAYVAVGHAMLGGLAASGGALAWGILAPVLALLLFDAAAALRWLAIYVVITLVAVVADPLIVEVAPASWTTPPPVLYVMSVLGPAVIVVILVRHVDGERLRAQRQYHGLLLRILPSPIVDRLTAGDRVVARHHASVTVVIADIAGFTAFAGRAAPEQLLELLTELFSAFDTLAAEAGVEKIKTIGDAYLAVAGAPTERPDHADAALGLAIAMQRTAATLPALVENGLGLRVGVASGPVTAGVIGTEKPAYDVWGDAVNLASRMESTGVVGHVQLTEASAALLGGRFPLTPRHAVPVKGKGTLTTYLVDAGHH
jgi:guanylate cyclase